MRGFSLIRRKRTDAVVAFAAKLDCEKIACIPAESITIEAASAIADDRRTAIATLIIRRPAVRDVLQGLSASILSLPASWIFGLPIVLHEFSSPIGVQKL